jgi:hypothetical protein
MQQSFDHNKLLKQKAKEILTPHSIYQKARSRTFLADNGWWTIMIEFQPSGFTKGTYLNVGLDFHFYPREYFAYSYGYRELDLKDAEDESSFVKVIEEYSLHAVKKTEEFRSRFKDINTAILHFGPIIKNDPWKLFDFAVLYGLSGNLSECRKILNDLINKECKLQHEVDRKKHIQCLLKDAINHLSFTQAILKTISETRELKRLPKIEIIIPISTE